MRKQVLLAAVGLLLLSGATRSFAFENPNQNPLEIPEDDDPNNPLPYPITLTPPQKPPESTSFIPEMKPAEFRPMPKLDFTFSVDLSKPIDKPKAFVPTLALPQGPKLPPLKSAMPEPVAIAGPVIAETNTDAGETTPIEEFDANRKSASLSLKAGLELLNHQFPAEALAKFEEGLERVPDNHGLLWNAGLAAYLSANYGTAVDYWKHLKELEPQSSRTRFKLIQAYQAGGKQKERDEERYELLHLYVNSRPDSLKKLSCYCRDQFKVAGRKVLVYEFFEPDKSNGECCEFRVLNAEGQVDGRLHLRSTAFQNETARDLSMAKEGERQFELRAQSSGKESLYLFYAREPGYDALREKVFDILNGKLTPAAEIDVISDEKANAPDDE